MERTLVSSSEEALTMPSISSAVSGVSVASLAWAAISALVMTRASVASLR
jgi:hypothetical protein